MTFVKDNVGKVRMSLFPQDVVNSLLRVLEHGARKYGLYNWQSSEDPVVDYGDAIYRHLGQIRSGEMFDDSPGGTGEPHAACILANAVFLTWFAFHHPYPTDVKFALEDEWHEEDFTRVRTDLPIRPAEPPLAEAPYSVSSPPVSPVELRQYAQAVEANLKSDEEMSKQLQVNLEWKRDLDQALFHELIKHDTRWEIYRHYGEWFHEFHDGQVTVIFFNEKMPGKKINVVLPVEKDKQSVEEIAKAVMDKFLYMEDELEAVV